MPSLSRWALQTMVQERSPSSSGNMGGIGDRSKDNSAEGGASSQALEATASTARASSGGKKKKQQQKFLRTLWQFSRPHTMIGTAIAIPTMGVFSAPPGEVKSCTILLSVGLIVVSNVLSTVWLVTCYDSSSSCVRCHSQVQGMENSLVLYLCYVSYVSNG